MSGKTSESRYLSDAWYWPMNQDVPLYLDKAHDVLLEPPNYLKLVHGERIQREYSLDQIRATASEMNNALRTVKMPEKIKPIFIAGVLIALSDDAFVSEYSHFTTFETVSDGLLQAIGRQLDNSDIPSYKIDDTKNSFSVVKKNPKLAAIPLGQRGSITWYVKELEMRIKPMMDHAGSSLDSLSVFYQEFVRYTSGDGKGLGIVLTPQHLTHFMAKLANVSKEDCVIDSCCGSGSFLVASMGIMAEQANAVEAEEVRRQRLYGIELDDEIYVLAIANMIVRGDGKSNIVHGDCFEADTRKLLRQRLKENNDAREAEGKSELAFTVGLINPPYSQRDKQELEFVKLLLGEVVAGGRVACVVPTSCALGLKFTETRRRLMAHHTLEAVFSMPDDLFYPTGVTVCVMLWTAGIPHDSGKKTFFGYCKDDGFVKAKRLGRIDKFNRWQAIEERWLELFRERDVEPGLSAKACVGPEDEWICEAYMETDYAQLSRADFEQTVADFLAYKVKSHASDLSPKFERDEGAAPEIDPSDWRWFKLGGAGGLFTVNSGKRLTKEDMVPGNLNFLGAMDDDNGVRDHIEAEPLFEGNAITVNYNGSVGEAFYQDEPYWPSDDVKTLLPVGWELDVYRALFVCTVIKLERFKFSYGRKWKGELMEKSRIKFPADSRGMPDWNFMEAYIKSLPYSNYL